MSRRVVWTGRSRKDLQKLDRRRRERIITAVERFAKTGHGDVRRLQGQQEPIYRLRVGDWRVFFSFEEQLVILILRVRPRGGAY